jgi:multiple sugar transport system ATP-binding protein
MPGSDVRQAGSTSPDGIAIRLVGIKKSFGDVVAVEHLDLEILDKELLVFLGPSGSGKTTTLNMLAGLEEPTGGEIYFGSDLVTHLPAEERDISMVFQTLALYPHLNVRENIVFPLKIRKTDTSVIDSRLHETVTMLGMDTLLDRRIHELSGGQRQRVAIAKALVRRPRLFLLDEPFSNLDAELRRQMRAELVRVHREVETTMVFVTHDQEEAMSIGDRLAVMDQGKLVQLGTPLEIYYHPVNLWMARFIGSHPINFIPCWVDDANQKASLLEADLWSVSLSPAQYDRMRQATAESEVTLGVRPEFMQLSPTPGPGQAAAEIYTRQILGTEILYSLRVHSHELRAVAPAAVRYERGDQVYVGFDYANAFVFDKSSGTCIVS